MLSRISETGPTCRRSWRERTRSVPGSIVGAHGPPNSWGGTSNPFPTQRRRWSLFPPKNEACTAPSLLPTTNSAITTRHCSTPGSSLKPDKANEQSPLVFLAMAGDRRRFRGSGVRAFDELNPAVAETYNWTRARRHWVADRSGVPSPLAGRQRSSSSSRRLLEPPKLTFVRIPCKRSEMTSEAGVDGRTIIDDGPGKTLQKCDSTWKDLHCSLCWHVTLARQGRLAEAEALPREGVLLRARTLRAPIPGKRRGTQCLAEVLAEQGRFGDAATIAKLSLDVYDRWARGHWSITKAAARKRLADAHVGQRSISRRRLAEYDDQIAADLAADPAGLQRLLQTNLTWAVASIREGRMREAANRLRAFATSWRA